MRNLLTYLLPIVLLTGACKLIPERAVRIPMPIKVVTQTVTLSEGGGKGTWAGEISASKSATLTAPYPGTIESIPVRKGSRVAKGQTIAVVRSSQVDDAVRIAKATLDQAKDALERVGKVYATGNVSEIQMMDIRTQVEKAEAAYSSACKTQENGVIKAPFGGMITDIIPQSGTQAALLQSIATIHDMGGLSVRISVHENEIGGIKTGMKATVDIPALDLRGVEATVSEKDMLASPLSHTYACTLIFQKTPAGLMPGMSVRVHIVKQGPGRIVIPASAVQMDSEGKYVWLDDKGVVRKARITTGGFLGTGVTVTSGLSEGDLVITKGYQKVSTGMYVTR